MSVHRSTSRLPQESSPGFHRTMDPGPVEAFRQPRPARLRRLARNLQGGPSVGYQGRSVAEDHQGGCEGCPCGPAWKTPTVLGGCGHLFRPERLASPADRPSGSLDYTPGYDRGGQAQLDAGVHPKGAEPVPGQPHREDQRPRHQGPVRRQHGRRRRVPRGGAPVPGGSPR
jgi:hypothetical protein